VRFTCVVLAGLVANAACGDGIGRPIRQAVANEGAAGADGGADASTLDGVQRTCAELADGWAENAKDAERALLELINQARGMEWECGRSLYDAEDPLQHAPELQCSARLHTLDMARYGFVRSTGSDNRNPEERMRAAGFDLENWEESLVVDEFDPNMVFERLIERYPDCSYVLRGQLTHIGIGFSEGYWTIDYAEEDAQDDRR